MMVVSAAGLTTATTSSLNVQTVSDFWMFVVYCLVVIVVVIFFLFYFNRVLGHILTWLINQYTWRRFNAYIEVDSIRVTLLGARILFKNLRYLSTNQSISIVKGHISIQYWLLNVREIENEKQGGNQSKLPCRIVCSLQGLEWFIYNNIPAYEAMSQILGLATSSSSSSSSSKELNVAKDQDPESQVPASGVEASLLRRLMPIQFECTTGAVMIGNNELRSMIVGELVQANGIWSTMAPRVEMDQYKSVLDLVLRSPRISLKDNMDYTCPQEPASLVEARKRSSFLHRLWSGVSMPFRKLFHPATRTRQFGHMQHMHDLMHTRYQDSDSATNRSTTFHEEYARVNNLLECSKMKIRYYADIPGPVPSTAAIANPGVGTDVGNGGLPPEWGVRLSVWNAMIHYGPWTDRQRTSIQDYFYPSSHRNNAPTPYRKVGEQRISTAFEFLVDFETEATLRIPTKERSKDWRYESGSADLDLGADGFYTRPYGWIDIKAAAGSSIKTVTPYVWGLEGSTSTIDVHLKKVDASTSVNYASLITAKTIDFHIGMPSPLVWNAHREWTIGFSIEKPRVFLLRDHVFLFQDLVKDWTSTPPPDILHFIPVTYSFNANVSDPLIYLCVNEHNIISNPNSLEDNAYIKLHSQKLHFNMKLPFTNYEPETNAVKFLAELEHVKIGISLQTSHTLHAFLEEENAQFGVAVNVTIDGSYEYYTTVDVLRHIESMNLDIKLNGVTCKLFGTVIRYLIILRDNYVGAWVNFSTIDEYRQRRQNQREYLEMKKKQADAKPIEDPFEVYILVDVQDGSLLLPENLYDCTQYSQMDFQELQVELRNLDIYMDMYVNVSPITWTRESYVDPSSKKAFIRTRNVRDQGNYLYIDELNIYAHRLFGPLPDVATYLCHWEFEIGRIFGEVKPSFLLGTASFGQTFVYDMIDEDNAVPAEVAPAADPDVTFVKASIKEIDVYLINENSAANVCIGAGLDLKFDNLVNEKYNQRISVHMPEIVATALANQEDYTKSTSRDDFSWVEVARMNTGMDLTIFRHSKEWKRLRKAQQNFIRAQDNPTRRCTHLYNEEEDGAQRDNHVGVLYAPIYRSFHTVGPDDAVCARKPSESPFRAFSKRSDAPSLSSYIGDWAGSLDMPQRPSRLQVERYSMRSGTSIDNESFHTAYSGDEFSPHPTQDFDLDEAVEAYEQYSAESASESDAEVVDHFVTFSSAEERLTSGKPRETAIPPSIPYSGYLNRYSVKRAAAPSGRSYGFFHPYLPPPQTRFEALKDDDNKRDSGLGLSFIEKGFLFPESKDYPEGCEDILGTQQEEDEDDGDDTTGNEVIVTTVLEATKPLQILMTPILVKIVQEVTETINRYDWDLETMLDTLQIDYVGQLTRYLTERFVCTRFAVSLPGTHFHFIQNVMLPDDLPSYKDGRTYIKTQYDSEESMLCSADVILKDFSMIGSVKFEDLAYDEKKKSVAESKMVLRESRVHIDLGHLNCKVYYVGARHDQIRQPIMFGIPQSRRHSTLDPYIHEDDEDVASKLLMIDLELNGFMFRWLGAQKPNYFNLEIDNLSTIIITEAVEILAGAVYSWLAFVDDLKAILENFQDQRSRLIQLFINELANYSQLPAAIGDPLFLTKPTNVLRLGSRNFRNDVGWKLLARMRYCLRTMDTGSRASLQFRLSRAVNAGSLDSKSMFNNVIEKFSLWRSWEISKQDISLCRLFTQPFKQKPLQVHDKEPLSQEAVSLDPLAEFLISSMNLAKVRIKSFDFCIFEEEQDMDDNSIVIDTVDLLLDSVYKRPLIGSHEEEGVIKEKPDSRLLARDGYLDVVTKASIDTIKITMNPAILAFARHMLTVQRVFTTKLRSLSHATRTASSNSLLRHVEEEPEKPFDLQKILNQVDIVAQALVTVQEIDICARAQKLTMQSLIRKIQGSALFSNPKLTPLPLFASSDKADSDTGSGVRSSTKASRRNTSSTHSNRLILEAAGGVDCVDIRFYEILTRNHPLVNELLVITLEGVNVNSNISQSARSSKKQISGSSASNKDILNIFSNIHKCNVHAPQSLLRLYSFVEDWRAEQGQRYEFLFQNLLTEWEEQRKVAMPLSNHRPQNPVMKYEIKLQFLLNQFGILFDLLPSLSVEYNISDFFVLVHDTVVKGAPVQKYAVQLAKQELHLITKNSSSLPQQKQIHEEYAGGTFSIPSIRSTGSVRSENHDGVTTLWLKSRIFVDYISLTLNANMIDSLLTTQSLVGNEISDLLEVLSYDKRKRRKKESSLSPASSASATRKIFKYGIDISLKGLRISAESPAATGVFESNIFEACMSNEASGDQDRLLWSMKGHKFALSLEHNNDLRVSKRRNRLAYIVADFELQNYLPGSASLDATTGCNLDTYYIDFKRIQAVMQPIALGKLAEMYIYYDAELKKKKEQKRTELERLTANTKRLVSSFKREAPGAQEAAVHSLLEGKVLSLNVRRLGIAIPLDQSSTSDAYHAPKETSALLLSIGTMHLLTKDFKKTAAQLSNISLQFVKRFDQNNEEHFSAEKHPRMNQMYLPSISCHVYTRSEKPRQLVKIDAEVGGFEVDVDGAFSEYLNALSVIYVKSKDRVDAFANISKGSGDAQSSNSSSNSSNTIDSKHAFGSNVTNNSEIVYLDIEGAFKYKSGTLRMYPKRHSGEVVKKKQRSGNEQSSSKDSSSRMATVVIPGLTAWVTYQTPLGRLSSVSDAPRRIHGDIMIHESDNTLHPSLVQFLQEVIAGLKFGMQKSSERKAVQTSSSTLDPNINASLVLRLSSTKLHLSCQPASKVVCSLSWNESEFLMNSFTTETALRSMSCIGSLRNVSVVVKHHFSPEACLTASIDQVLLNTMLISRRRQGATMGEDDISITVRIPTVMGDLNVRHLQDIFIIDTYWFSSSPELSEQQTHADEAGSSTSSSVPTPFARYVAIHVESIVLSADLGQAIGRITAKPNDVVISTHNIPGTSRGAIIRLDSIGIVSEGRLSGNAQFKQIALCTISDVQGEGVAVRNDDAIMVVPSLKVHMAGFSAIFEYEYQQILDMLQDRIDFNVQILQSEQGSTRCNFQANMVVEPLLACVSIKTVPVMVIMYKRLTELVEKKKLEAGLSAPPSKLEQRPIQKQQQRQVLEPWINLQSSHMDVRLDSLQFIVYPSQFQDVDNVEIYAQNLRLALDQQFHAETTDRQLVIHLEKAALLKSVPGDKLIAKRNAKRQMEEQPVTAPSSPTLSPPPAATTPIASDSKGVAGSKPAANGVSIFGIPSTTLQMDSVQDNLSVKHTFTAKFGGRINVSLNLGLIRYLQELVNMFNEQMDRAKEDRRIQPTSSQETLSLSKPAGQQADEESFDSGVGVRSPSRQTSHHSLQKADATLTYTSEAPVNFNPQLQIMGDATPPVEWLGLKRDRLPAIVHEDITLVLDQIVQAIWDLYLSQCKE